MSLFILLYLLFNVIACKPKPVRLSLSDKINTLGERITEGLVNPSNSSGDRLLKDVCSYYNKLDRLFALLSSSEEGRNEKGRRTYKELVDRGGPSWLLIDIDYDNLKKAYNWNQNLEVNHLKEAKTENEELWVSILELGEGKQMENVKVQK